LLYNSDGTLSMGKLLAWLVVLVALGLLVWGIAVVLRRREQRSATTSVEQVADDDGLAREALPEQLPRNERDLLARVRQLHAAGDYSRAMLYLFTYQLLQLDRHHLVHLSRGKTNRQYLGELRQRPPLDRMLERSVVAFEDVFFGHKQLSRARLDDCLNELPHFEQLLREGHA
jgi:hypothetical protein